MLHVIRPLLFSAFGCRSAFCWC